MPDENGKPMAGEWWGEHGKPQYYMVGNNPAGNMIFCDASGFPAKDDDGEWWGAVHLPDCTGWDWQPPDWVELDPVNYGWHVLRAGIDECKAIRSRIFSPVIDGGLAGQTIEAWSGVYEFRCLRKDLPQRPPEPAITSGGPYVSIEVHQAVIAERDALRERMREIEAKAKA